MVGGLAAEGFGGAPGRVGVGGVVGDLAGADRFGLDLVGPDAPFRQGRRA